MISITFNKHSAENSKNTFGNIFTFRCRGLYIYFKLNTVWMVYESTACCDHLCKCLLYFPDGLIFLLELIRLGFDIEFSLFDYCLKIIGKVFTTSVSHDIFWLQLSHEKKRILRMMPKCYCFDWEDLESVTTIYRHSGKWIMIISRAYITLITFV